MKKLSKNKKQYGTIFKLIAIVFSLITVTFSWFVFSKDGWVNPFDVNVNDVINVEISLDKENWTNKLVINENSENYGSFTEFSGNGDKLYIPIISNKEITGFYKPDYSNREVKDYVEINTFIKTNGDVKFYLDPSSSILPSSTTKYEDNIAGAVRVAFLIENYNPIIWAPNSTYQYVDENTFNKEGNVEEKYTYVYKNSDDSFVEKTDVVTINTNNLPNGVSEDKYFMWGDLSKIDNYTDSVLPIFKTNDVSEELIVPMTIRVWVEGTDREAMASLIGGKVKMNLKFMSVEI